MQNTSFQPAAHQLVLHSLQRLHGRIHGQDFNQDEVDRKLSRLRFKIEVNRQLTLEERERALRLLDHFRQAICSYPQ